MFAGEMPPNCSCATTQKVSLVLITHFLPLLFSNRNTRGRKCERLARATKEPKRGKAHCVFACKRCGDEEAGDGIEKKDIKKCEKG